MDSNSIIYSCNAPVVPRPGEPQDLLVLNTPMLSHWINERAINALVALMCTDANEENGAFDEYLPINVVELFTAEHDGHSVATMVRRTTAITVLDSIVNDVFMSYSATRNIALCTLHPAVTQLTVTVDGTRKTLLATAGAIAQSEDDEDISASIQLLAALDLFGAEHPDHPQPTEPLNSEDLIELNDVVSVCLAAEGWGPDTEEDYDDLNELTHVVARYEAQMRREVKEFIKKHS